jgi:hypothetical protein
MSAPLPKRFKIESGKKHHSRSPMLRADINIEACEVLRMTGKEG